MAKADNDLPIIDSHSSGWLVELVQTDGVDGRKMGGRWEGGREGGREDLGCDR